MGLFNFLFKKKTTHTLSTRLKESGNVFMMLFGAVGMVGVIGASTMTVMKGPVKTMSQVTKRTIAENNMIAAGKLALIASSSNDCDNDDVAEPVPFVTVAGGITGGGGIPTTIGVAKEDPWGNEYGYCTWDHGDGDAAPNVGDGDDDDGTCGGSSNFRTGASTATEYVLAIVSAGPDRMFNTTCDDFVAPGTPILNKTGGSDDIILGYTYAEAGAIAGGLWTDISATETEIARDVKIKDKSTGLVDTFAFDSDAGDLTIGGSGKFPVVNTDNIRRFSGAVGGTINVDSALNSGYDVTTTGDISGVNLVGSGTLDVDGNATLGDAVTDTTAITGIATVGATLDVTGATTLDGLTANTTSLGGTTSSSLSVTNNTTVGGTLDVDGNVTLGDANTDTVTTAGEVTVGGNIILGANYLTGDGTGNDGITIDASGNVTTSDNASIGGTLGVTGATTLAGLSAGATTLSGDLAMGTNLITGLGAPVAGTDAATKAYVDSAVSSGGADNLGDHTATQAVDMGTFKVTNMADPTAAADAATKSYVDAAVVSGADDLGNHTATTALNMSSNKITNVTDPTAAQDAATKSYVDTAVSGAGSGDALVDADNDTKIQVEESTDEDIIRMDVAGAERVVIDSNFEFFGTNNNAIAMSLKSYGNAASHTSSPLYNMARANGTLAAPTAALNGNRIGALNWVGHDGTDYDVSVGEIAVHAAEDFTSGTNRATNMRFYTRDTGNASHTERMRISPEGYVGIGTSSPDRAIELYNSGADYKKDDVLITSVTDDISYSGALLFQKQKSTGGYLVDDASIGAMRAFAYNGSNIGNGVIGNNVAGIFLKADGAHSAGNTPGKIDFMTAPSVSTGMTSRMIIDSTGNVGVGITDPKSKLHVDGDLLLTNSATTCGADQKGALRLNASDDGLEMCDGAGTWSAFGGGGGADNLGNHTATTALDMATNKITNLADPTVAQDAATKSYVDTAVVAGADDLGNHQATQNLDLNTYKLVGNNGSDGITISATGAVTASKGITAGLVTSGSAVVGSSSAAGGAGIDGLSTSFLGYGVRGSNMHASGHGVYGAGGTNGYGIYGIGNAGEPSAGIAAQAGAGGTALRVFGQANMQGNKIVNMTDPTLAQDAATKAYVDSVAGGGGGVWTDLSGQIYYNSGLVGIGNTDPKAVLHVSGELLLENSASTCDADIKGALRLNAALDTLEMCDGAGSWNTAGDNLGNHTATTALDMATNNITNVGTITASADPASFGTITATNTGDDLFDVAVYGHSSYNGAQNTWGVGGRVDSTSGWGVYGSATNTTGVTAGIHGQVSSTSGRGVWGKGNAVTGTNYGGYFQAAGDTARAVYGLASHATGQNYAGYFQSSSSQGTGVFAWGKKYGMHALTDADGGRAVWGVGQNTGITYGVYGQSGSATGFGGYFTNMGGGVALGIGSGVLHMGSNKITNLTDPTAAQDAATKAYVDAQGGGDTLAGLSCTDGQVAAWNNGGGVWICANNGSGAGDDLGNHTATTDLDMASNDINNVQTFSASSASASQTLYSVNSNTAGKGIFGYASATTGSNEGVYGQSQSTSGSGVFGWAAATTGSNMGVYGGSASTTGYGVYGEATATSGASTGIRGTSASAAGFGGHFTNTNGGVALALGSGAFDMATNKATNAGGVIFTGVAGNAPTK